MIPVLITFDVDSSYKIKESIELATRMLNKLDIKATFFFVANHANKEVIQKLILNEHEISCHGLNHDDFEELNNLGYESQKRLIEKATKKLEKLVNNKIISFRGPRVKISSATLMVLEQLGYKVDSTVNSQRLDFISSNLINPGWLIAPRKPYFPSEKSPYKKGSLN